MLHRLLWLFRLKVKFRSRGVRGRLSSFADRLSFLEGSNYLAQRAKVLNSRLGRFTYVNYDAVVSNAVIGRFACVGPHALVGGVGKHPIDRRSLHRMFYSESNAVWAGFTNGGPFAENATTYVGNDVWIGLRAVIMDGVRIGSGAIIAAGAVVVSDVEPYSIVGGVPAKLIKRRFPSETIEMLCKEKWWDKDICEIREMAKRGAFSESLHVTTREGNT